MKVVQDLQPVEEAPVGFKVLWTPGIPFQQYLPSTGEAPYSTMASCRQCSYWHVVASIPLPASWFIFHCIFTAIFAISINVTKEKVVIDHDKAINSVGKCIPYCLLLNRKWVVIFLLNYSDTCSLWLWRRQFHNNNKHNLIIINIIYASAFWLRYLMWIYSYFFSLYCASWSGWSTTSGLVLSLNDL